MAFKEVSVSQVKEVLRRWLHADEGVRRVAIGAGVNRKTAQRYIDAAQALGATREGGAGQLSDELVAAVVQAVRPGRRVGRGEAWSVLQAQHGYVQELIDKGLPVVKVGDLLERRGIVVPERTLHRYCAELCGGAGARTTVRLADPEPGREAQTDVGRMGIMFDPACSRRRAVHALILVAVWSRHMFVWLTFTQTTADVIEGFEHAWEFFGRVFPVVIPDNLSPVVTKAEPKATRLDATYDAELRKLLGAEVLIIDDFALQAMDATETADFYALVVERHRVAATVITSNRDPSEWLAFMADPMLAQSAVDRLQSAAFELVIEGESYRRREKPTLAHS